MLNQTLERPPDIRDILEEARRALAAERVLLTEVSFNTQYVLFSVGLSLPKIYSEEMPLSHSICQHMVGMRFPLKIDDAFTHPLLKGSRAMLDLNIGSYLGYPIGMGFPTLAICGLCPHVRVWTEEDSSVLSSAASKIRSYHSTELAKLSKSR